MQPRVLYTLVVVVVAAATVVDRVAQVARES
jgi:hypothetical protein